MHVNEAHFLVVDGESDFLVEQSSSEVTEEGLDSSEQVVSEGSLQRLLPVIPVQ